MLDDRQSGLLRDLLDSARLIQTYLAGVSREEFFGDGEKQDAVLRRFEIIGEVASRLGPEAQALFPLDSQIRPFCGHGHFHLPAVEQAHDYGEVDL